MQQSDTHSSPAPASEKVWHTPELVLLILPHLVRERIDLIAISHVSRALRAMALPLLVRILDLDFYEVEPYKALFDRNPHLVQCVRFVRIVDSYAVTAYSYRDRRRPSKEEVELARGYPRTETFHQKQEDRMMKLKTFIEKHCANARLDITASLSLVYGLYNALMHQGINEKIVALRWIADPPEWSECDDTDPEYVQLELAHEWDSVSAILNRITKAQEGSDVKLETIQIQERMYKNGRGHSAAMASLRDILDSIPTAHICSLLIQVQDYCITVFSELSILERNWPHLTRATVNVLSGQDHDFTPAYGEIHSFLSDQPLLEHLDIFACYEEQSETPHLYFENEFPNLKTIALASWNAPQIGDFLLQHGHKLVDLELPMLGMNEDTSTVIKSGLKLPSMRVLRAPANVVAALTVGQYAPQVAHIELKPVGNYYQLKLDEWMIPHSDAAQSITCLEIELTKQTLLNALEGMTSSNIIDADRFPSLVELSLCSTHPNNADASFDAKAHVEHILAKVSPLASLRALRVEEMVIQPFPHTSAPIEIITELRPPKLEYLSWHSAEYNRTQYFRILHQPVRGDSGAGRRRVPSAVLLRMQRLPASFRAQITEDGEWVQPSRLRHANIIFDHTVSPPRLPRQPGMLLGH